VSGLRILLAALGIALAGCQFGDTAEADPVGIALNQEFTLNGGQEAVINDDNLRLRFTEVLEDHAARHRLNASGRGRLELPSWRSLPGVLPRQRISTRTRRPARV
jgi:hypothetical protein